MKRKTREIKIGKLRIGGDNPIAVQSMTATKTSDIEGTKRQIRILCEAGADIIRIAVDTPRDLLALKEVYKSSTVPLSIDMQENWRIAEDVAPYVDKIRYNPGHLHHLEKDMPVLEKVRWLTDVAKKNDLAIRIGVNGGSVDPAYLEKYDDEEEAIVASAVDHCKTMDEVGFENFCVSLKDSDPQAVIRLYKKFSELRPDVPTHLGVTEAGLIPEGVIKTRIAFEQLITQGIGDTIRVSLTVPFDDKGQEISYGREILKDIKEGRFRSVPEFNNKVLNIISCPSCSRVENEKFVDLAMDVKKMTEYAKDHDITIAVMGCRVNGPGETDSADLGLWCAPTIVNFKKGEELIGTFSYEEILPKLKMEVDKLIIEKSAHS
jgi:(E)-4-hydroxy-3-methylbut-2-enyl-diphosphate synthase